VCADDYLICVSEQHIDEPEAGLLGRIHPTHGHLVIDAIGVARAQERRVVIAE
jgi:hypothetical protein